MNTQKFKKFLKKINSFDDWIEDLEEMSVIEQDLLLDYVKKLYESVIEGDDEDSKTEVKKKKLKKNKKNVKKIIETAVEEVEEEKSIIEEKAMDKEVIEEEPIEEEVEEEIGNSITFSQEFLDLFENKGSTELSEKLSLSSIKNLTKAFSINERIFTIKELFGGDKNDFEKTINNLDKLDSLVEAKSYIMDNVANKYGWDEKSMIKKVRQFVVTVKRRYL